MSQRRYADRTSALNLAGSTAVTCCCFPMREHTRATPWLWGVLGSRSRCGGVGRHHVDFTAMPTATWVLSPKGREALTHSPSRDHGRFNYKLRARGTLPRTSPSYRVGAFEEEISLLLRRLCRWPLGRVASHPSTPVPACLLLSGHGSHPRHDHPCPSLPIPARDGASTAPGRPPGTQTFPDRATVRWRGGPAPDTQVLTLNTDCVRYSDNILAAHHLPHHEESLVQRHGRKVEDGREHGLQERRAPRSVPRPPSPPAGPGEAPVPVSPVQWR